MLTASKAPRRKLEGDLVVVTGVGVQSPIGCSASELMAAIRSSRSGLSEIRSFDVSAFEVKHAGEIREPLYGAQAAPHWSGVDRTGVLAVLAAEQAVGDSGLELASLAPARVGLSVGVCAGGHGKAVIMNDLAQAPEASAAQLLSTSHYAQTTEVARHLGVHGPCVTLSTACASSASSLAYGWELLMQGVVDVVIAGGADAFSFFTYAGFHALGAMARQPCAPFSQGIGVTFGEGAAFVVLERATPARARQARIYGVLLGYGATADCYHMTSPDPSGAGLERAMREGLLRGGIEPGLVDYVNAHGTGTHDNDLAETSAIKALFAPPTQCPAVSSSKSFFGHTMGAAGALEFVTSLLCQAEGLIPPTLQFTEPRPGCTLDYVPNVARHAPVRAFLSNSAAFGGVNVSLVGCRADLEVAPPAPPSFEPIVLSGLGVVSPLGWALEQVRAALAAGESALTGVNDGTAMAGKLKGFDLRRVLPTVEARRLDRINQLVLGASALALADGKGQAALDPLRVGSVMAHTRGPAGTEQRFFEAVRRDGLERLSPKYFPAIVLSTTCGQVCEAFQLRGFTSTVVDGIGAGLHALVHAFHTLRGNAGLDAVLVSAGDEVGGLYETAYQSLGRLSRRRRPALYAPDADGTVIREGSVALLLEKKSSAERRGARIYATVSGCGAGTDAASAAHPDREGRFLVQAMQTALTDAGLAAEQLGMIYGHARGIAVEDACEVSALRALLRGAAVPVGCVTGNVGLMEASSALLSVAAAALSLNDGLVYPIVSDSPLPSSLDFVSGAARAGSYVSALVTASTEYGNHAAVVLETEKGASA